MRPWTTELGCPTDADFSLIFDGLAPRRLVDAAAEHALGCPPCSELLVCAATMLHARREAAAGDTTVHSRGLLAGVAGGTDPSRPRDELVGTAIGRYRLVEKIGEGGMGVVFAAKDETLQRTVAVKLLRGGIERDGRRLLREARAMATVRHPNVMTIHDSGVHDEQVFVVMDFVLGGDLRDWMLEGSRSWRQIVDVWAAAGRGLQAVHDAGLVHRDFKPANVLVDRDGTVQVSDFGLVGAQGAIETALEDSRPTLDDSAQTARVVGTPRYMPPEQIEGRPVDGTADQFAFCVSLWEALTGVHPVTGIPTAHGQTSAPRAVPAGVLKAIGRGLGADPTTRYPSMAHLLAAVRRATNHTKQRRKVAMGVTIVGAALSVGGWFGTRGEPPCPAHKGADVEGTWDVDNRARLRRGMEASRESAAQQTRVLAEIGEYTENWIAARTEACAATRVRGEVSLDVLDRKMACLDAKRAAVDALIQIVADVPPARRGLALELAHGLPGIDSCANLEHLVATPLPELASDREQLGTAERALALARKLREAGRYAEAEAKVSEALDIGQTIAWNPLIATALLERAQLERARDSEAAVATWRDAYAHSITTGHSIQYDAAFSAIGILADAGLSDEARFFHTLTQAHAAALGGEKYPGDLATAAMYVAIHDGDLEEAEQAAREAISAREGQSRPLTIAGSYANLGGILAVSGRTTEALAFTNLGLEVSEEALGLDHPRTLLLRHNRALTLFDIGELDGAAADVEESLETLATMNLPLSTASALNLRGEIRETRGDVDGARVDVEAAAHIRRDVLPSRHNLLAETLTDLGRIQRRQGALDEAIRSLGAAIESSTGTDPRLDATSHLERADALTAQGNIRSAADDVEKATALLERSSLPVDDLRIRAGAWSAAHAARLE